VGAGDQRSSPANCKHGKCQKLWKLGYWLNWGDPQRRFWAIADRQSATNAFRREILVGDGADRSSLDRVVRSDRRFNSNLASHGTGSVANKKTAKRITLKDIS